MRAYKYVDLEHADAVQRGVLKIGTLRAYAELEGLKKDNSEATVIRKVNELYIDDSSKSSDQIAMLQEMGISISNSYEITIKNFSHILQHEDVNCFCMARTPDNFRLNSEKPQAVFEITGVRSLAEQIVKQEYGLSGIWRQGKVSYAPRIKHVDSFSAVKNFVPDPFIKEEQYAAEDEIRIIWQPSASHPVKEFFTSESRLISQFIRRIV